MHEAQGRFEMALERVQALLSDDPLQEMHHCEAMRLLAACGRREALWAQYNQCIHLLKTKLGLQPMAETVALLQALLCGLLPSLACTGWRQP